MIKLIDIEGNTPIPTEHCRVIKWLKVILDNFEEKEAMDIIAYIFYMSCNSEENPFFNVREEEREDIILDSLETDIDIEDPLIITAVVNAKKLYETPTYRSYLGIKVLIDKISQYMKDTTIEHGRDGNLSQVINAAKSITGLKATFKELKRDLEEEQKQIVRGGINLGYDQD